MITRKEGRSMEERELPGPDPMPENMGDGGLPDSGCAPDSEWDAYVAWRDREIAAGRDEKPPEPWEIEGPAVSLSLGDATDIDPAILAAGAGRMVWAAMRSARSSARTLPRTCCGPTRCWPR
jgi:hypothetical protein